MLIRFRWVWSALMRERPLKITSESSISFRFESEMAKISPAPCLLFLCLLWWWSNAGPKLSLYTGDKFETGRMEEEEDLGQAGFSFDYASSPRLLICPICLHDLKVSEFVGVSSGSELLDYAIICKLWAPGGQQRIEKGGRIGSSFHWKRLSNTVVVLNCLNKEG